MIARRAFSLIEVLIAVVALAIGLLGLAAVYPVIVGQQRDAANSTTGESFTQSVRAYLKAHADLNNTERGWNALYDNLVVTPLDTWKYEELYDTANPKTSLLWPASGGSTDLFIPVSERLWPTRAASASRPRLVWDMAAFIPQLANGDPGPMRVAVFVRPVDPGIPDRPGAGNSAWEQLLNGDRIPIAEVSGVPSRDGTPPLDGVYAPLFGLDIEVYDFRTGEEFDGSEPGHVPNGFRVVSVTDNTRDISLTENALSRVGQRIVDRHGNVYRVTGSKRVVGTPNFLILRVSPSVPSSVYSGTTLGNPNFVDSAELNPCLASTVAPVVDPFILEITP